MKLISGGQQGVDQAALDAAIELEIPHGGWCPQGRQAERNTIIPSKYKLKETGSSNVNVRTKLNIRDSDGTLIIVPSIPPKVTDGTILTMQEVKRQNKPYLIVSLSNKLEAYSVVDWLNLHKIEILNVAGPRESQSPGIYKSSFNLIKLYLTTYIECQNRRDEKNFFTSRL